MAERRCVPGREDCRAHEIGHLQLWWTRIHTTAVGFLFCCHAEPGLYCSPRVNAVRHQDARGFFLHPTAALQSILLSTRNRVRQKLLMVGINPHTRYSSTFFCFHSCTARVVALHQDRACGASGVRREKCLFPFRILEGRQPFPRDSRAGFLLCDGSNSQQPPYLPCVRS